MISDSSVSPNSIYDFEWAHLKVGEAFKSEDPTTRTDGVNVGRYAICIQDCDEDARDVASVIVHVSPFDLAVLASRIALEIHGLDKYRVEAAKV